MLLFWDFYLCLLSYGRLFIYDSWVIPMCINVCFYSHNILLKLLHHIFHKWYTFKCSWNICYSILLNLNFFLFLYFICQSSEMWGQSIHKRQYELFNQNLQLVYLPLSFLTEVSSLTVNVNVKCHITWQFHRSLNRKFFF